MELLLWKCINRLNLARKWKHRLFLAVNVILYGLLGYLAWLIAGKYVLINRSAWMLTFIGYPAVLGGFLLGIFLLFKMDQ